jgi:hypothetical protein
LLFFVSKYEKLKPLAYFDLIAFLPPADDLSTAGPEEQLSIPHGFFFVNLYEGSFLLTFGLAGIYSLPSNPDECPITYSSKAGMKNLNSL